MYDRRRLYLGARLIISLQYAFATQVAARGLGRDAIIEMSPREGEYTLRTSDILDVIAREGSSIALVIFSGVQYYTGQAFAIETITRAAKAQVSSTLFPQHASKYGTGRLIVTAGMHVWMGFSACCRQHSPFPTRMGHRLRGLVHVQVP